MALITADAGARLARAVAEREGMVVERSETLREASNVVVRLEPAGVAARVSRITEFYRRGGAYSWFEREAAVSTWLAERGVPAPRHLAGPFREPGAAVSFAEFVPHDPHVKLGDADFAEQLRELHGVLAGYERPTIELREVLEELDWVAQDLFERGRPQGETDAYRHALEDVLARLGDRLDGGQQLHGDAHGGNMLITADGHVWSDLEDTCRGPVEYDLATVIANARLLGDRDEATLRAGYGRGIDDDLLELLIEARLLQTVCWSALIAVFEPHHADAKREIAWWFERRARR